MDESSEHEFKIPRSEKGISMQSKLTLKFSFQFYADDFMKSKNMFFYFIIIWYFLSYIDDIKIWKRIHAMIEGT